MGPCSLRRLQAALSARRSADEPTTALQAWLSELPGERARALVRRVLALDAPLLATSLASLGSCLYARALAEPALFELAAAWADELEALGEPWVQALRPAPLPEGLVAQLAASDLPAEDAHPDRPHRLALPSGATLELWRLRGPHAAHAPSAPRAPRSVGPGFPPERLAWRWRSKKPTDDAAGPTWRTTATFHKDGWGPVSLVRGPGAPPRLLPCPKNGSAEARFSDDGAALVVHGSRVDYGGGFAMLLDPDTLEERLSIATDEPVTGVSSCDRPDRLLLHSDGGAILWLGGALHRLPVPEAGGRLSPDGEYLATGSDAVRVWSVAELLAAQPRARTPGVGPVFSPSGDRLVAGHTLVHGRTGEGIAMLRPTLAAPLEGGAPRPHFHCTERFLIHLEGGLALWSTATGQPVVAAPSQEAAAPGLSEYRGSALGMSFPASRALAFDAAGTTLAELHGGHRRVLLHPLPPSGWVRVVTFELEGRAVALDREGLRVAVAGDAALEVRTPGGLLLRRVSWSEARAPTPGAPREVRLVFSRDAARVACSVADEPWRVWALTDRGVDEMLAADAALATLPDFASPALAGWAVQARDGVSVFTHLATGTRVAFPASGDWVVHPTDGRMAASLAAHVRLRAAGDPATGGADR